ncbi:arsenate reductase family protein [Tropicibacter sp. Alg240-R139]|uniref:arsenate reductase family protein n=1 Tax=Tropicibacter sp. Alg240-R139 TaxID=2305991 RepID=UPI0013DFD7D1|nr:arsenate reductase family protein [Tropicibacter sp. Alg240-R139]
MEIVIHHNPACGTSRNVLRIIRDAGYDPVVVPYMDTGWTRPQLQALFAVAGITPRQALRTSKSRAEEFGLLDLSVLDEGLLDAMLEHPVLVNRPIVACANGVKLCRPSGVVLDLLNKWPPAPWAKEDGTLLINEQGKRLPE